MSNARIIFTALLAFAALPLLPAADDPWTSNELMQPADLAKRLNDGEKPLTIFVGPGYLFRARHITGSADAGMASKPEGIDGLQALVKGKSPTTEIILYCGCCPMNVCPNIRPAVRTLKEMGFKNVKVLHLADRLADNWTAKGYPTETTR